MSVHLTSRLSALSTNFNSTPPKLPTLTPTTQIMDHEDLDDEAAAMATAMGFSTFGSHKPPAKKRKFNPATDAFVSGQELEKIDRGGKKGQGSGGNNMPLGKLRTFGGVAGNEDEIDVDEDENEDEGTVQAVPVRRQMNLPAVTGSGSVLPVRNLAGNEDEIGLDDEDGEEGGANIFQPEGKDGPSYVDTSHSPPAAAVAPLDPSDPEAIEMQARIDLLLASIEEGQSSKEPAPIPVGSEAELTHPLPPRPAQQSFNHLGHGGGGRGGFSDTASIASSRPSHGERNPKWYEGYYDPSFNENPWKKIETEKGLVSLGNWLEPSNDRFRRT